MAHDVSALKEVFKKLFMVAVPFMISICLITYLIKLNSLSDGLSTNILLGYVKSLSPGLKGLMIAGLFAILMSTADSYMNATTAVISNDFIKKSFPMIGAKKLLLITRGVMLLLSCFPFILAIYKDQLFKFMLIFRSFGTIMLIVPLSLALFNFYITKWQFKFSIFLGIAFMVVNFTINDHYQFTSAIACILGNIVGLLLHKNAYVKLDKKITGLFFIIFAGIKKFFFFILELRCSTINKLNKKIKEHSTISEYFGLFIMSYYLIFSFFIESNKNMLPHLIVAGYICSLLLFVLKGVLLSEKAIEKYGYILHFVCVTLCLPIISSYLLFYYVGNNQTSYFWIVNSLLTTFLLYQFLGSFAFLLSMTIGFICGAVIYMIEFQTIDVLHALSILGYVYFSFIFISQVIARGREVKAAEKEKLYSQKSEVMKLFTELLSHELNHPAIVTHSVADTCQEILKAIKQGKRQPNEENIELVEEYIITGNLYKRFETMAKKLDQASEYALGLVDNVLTSLKGEVDHKKPFKRYKIANVVKQGIEKYLKLYPDNDNITVKIHDNFEVAYLYLHLVNIIVNLLKNTQSHSGHYVEVEIWTKENTLFYKDYGIGIKEEELSKIFNRFYTSNGQSTGLGLYFCKQTMKNLGGSIKCESIIDKYTTFIFSFPKVT